MNPVEWFRKRAHGPLTDEGMLAVRSAAADAQRSRLPQMAAALSFRTLFGIIPVLVVALLIANRFLTHDTRTQVIQRAVEFAGLGTLEVNADTIPGSARTTTVRSGQRPAETDPEANQVGPFVAPGAHGLADVIGGLVSNASSSRALGAVGIIGLITLIYAAVSLLVEIERAFNQIFRVPRGRSWFRRVINYWTLLTLGGIGLAATLVIGAEVQLRAQHIVEANGFGTESGSVLIQVIGYSITVFISTLMLALVYATVPNTRVKPLAALVGGFMGALLWEAGKWAFGQYVAYSSGYAKLYGSLAIIPLFMLWVYYTWLIVLFGLLVVYQFQVGRWKVRPQPLLDIGPTIVDPTSGLVVMTAMARAMAAGTPQSVKNLAINTGLGEGVVSLVVARFAERGLLLRVERDGEGSETLYALARTPGSIRVGEVLSLGFELAGGPESNPVVARMRKAQVNAAGSETLADIAGTPGDGQAKPAATPPPTPPASPTPPLPAATAPIPPANPGGEKPVLVSRPVRP
jgi:YihY family inner membrane protein